MQARTASVSHISINGLTYSGIANIGDAAYASPTSRGIAVQKEGAAFRGDHGMNFADYALFQRAPHWPSGSIPVHKSTSHYADCIRVNNIRINGVTQAAIFQIGNLDHVCSDARLKHFRRYLDVNTHNNGVVS